MDQQLKPSSDLYIELGGTGTVLSSGFLIPQEYNYDLTGTKRIQIYDQMRLGDSTVKLGLAAVKYPILSTNWFIKSDDEKMKEFVEDQLMNNPFFTWSSFLRQALTFLDYGNAVFEKVFIKLPDGKIGWKKLAPRLSKTIYRWTLSDGKTPGITQITPTEGSKEIPLWKLVLLVNDQEGENYEGISLLRAAYKHWYMKDSYYKIDAIATEKQGLGIPVLTVPPQAKPEDKAKAEEIVKNLRANEMAYAKLPPGFKIEFIDMKANQIKNSEVMVMHHDRQIAKAFLAQFLEIGAQGSSGAYAASQDQSFLFYMSLQQIAKTVQETLNAHIKELVMLNFATDPKKVPVIEYAPIKNIDLDKFATALNSLAGSQILIPDDELEAQVRQLYDLPEKAEGYDRETIEKKKQQEAEAQFENDLEMMKQKGNGFKKPLLNREAVVQAHETVEDIMELREEIRGLLHERQTA